MASSRDFWRVCSGTNEIARERVERFLSDVLNVVRVSPYRSRPPHRERNLQESGDTSSLGVKSMMCPRPRTHQTHKG